jgi:hypothetical protein
VLDTRRHQDGVLLFELLGLRAGTDVRFSFQHYIE